MAVFRIHPNRIVTVLLSLMVLVLSTGCVARMAANLIYAAHGDLIPAKYEGLEGKKVAVVCVSNTEAFGPRPISTVVAEKVNQCLKANVDKITIIDQQEVNDWIDRNDWDYLNYNEVGKGVKADMVVAIDLDSFSILDGPTMLKGRADVRVVVYDVTQKDEVFAYSPPQIQYPKNAVYHKTEMSENEFRRQFVDILASRIARHFHSYDAKEDFAKDTTLIN